jgi:hypothetical protein
LKSVPARFLKCNAQGRLILIKSNYEKTNDPNPNFAWDEGTENVRIDEGIQMIIYWKETRSQLEVFHSPGQCVQCWERLTVFIGSSRRTKSLDDKANKIKALI